MLSLFFVALPAMWSAFSPIDFLIWGGSDARAHPSSRSLILYSCSGTEEEVSLPTVTQAWVLKL